MIIVVAFNKIQKEIMMNEQNIKCYDVHDLRRALRKKKLKRKDIADELAISPRTLRKHLDSDVADYQNRKSTNMWLDIKKFLSEKGIIVLYK